MRNHNYYLYILSSFSRVIYIGMTNNLERRVLEHREGAVEGFSKKYNCHNLIYFEHYTNVDDCIMREKQLKCWNRHKKEVLIRTMNPDWKNLSEGIF